MRTFRGLFWIGLICLPFYILWNALMSFGNRYEIMVTNNSKEDIEYRVWDESEGVFRDGQSAKGGGTSQVVITDVLTGFLELYVFEKRYLLPDRRRGEDQAVAIDIDGSLQVTIEEVF